MKLIKVSRETLQTYSKEHLVFMLEKAQYMIEKAYDEITTYREIFEKIEDLKKLFKNDNPKKTL